MKVAKISLRRACVACKMESVSQMDALAGTPQSKC